MLIFIICLWIFLAILVGLTAAGRGRKGVGWTLLACLISPVVAGAFLLAITDRSPRAKTPAPATHQPCPACGKRIPVEARVCLHCGVDVAKAAADVASASPREGYWFDTPESGDTLVREGNYVRLPAPKPPWMVIDQSLHSIIVNRWPGQLWRVRVTALGDMSGLVAQPGYWRAEAIELIEALPLSTLFGPQGDAVLRILDAIETMTRTDAQTLAQNVHPDAANAYGRAWLAWSQGEEAAQSTEDWQHTLAASRGRDKDRSPIHAGFLLIHSQLRQRAQAVDGANAIERIEDEDDGEIEEVLAPLWQQASDALCYAAMAQGAPEWVSDADAQALNRAWVALNAQRER